MEALLDKQIPVLAARERAALDLKDGARLEVLAQGDHGSILLVRYKRFRALLGAGADPALASALPGKGLLEPVTVALLPEGGFAPANPREWLEELDPQVVLLSAGSADRALTLNQSPLDQLEGRTILRTDRHGWIEITTDGRSLWVQVERTPMGGQSAPNGSPPPHEPSE
jgi:beta-lactamase superfamily II metal-dependent hydrolase